MRCVELFAGAGGAALGLERAGFEHVALCEWDRDACATLRAAGLGPVVQGDVRDLDAIAAVVGPDPVNVLWSSFPCQAFSTAGKRLGAADERNGWPWATAALDRFRPSWFLGENVRGLLLHTGGCTFAGGQEGLFSRPDPMRCPGCYFELVILPDLRRRFKYVGWWLLDAADFGVPQHRRRVILWAGPRQLTEPAPTHGPGRALPWVSMGEALGLPVGSIAQSGVCDTDPGTHGVPRPTTRPSPAVPVGSCIYIGGGANPRTKGRPQDRTERDLTHEPSTTITAEVIGNAGPWVIEATTIRRRLTPTECAILQDFPADHPFQGGIGAQYRQVGNAVPPRLAQAVGRAIIESS